MSSDLRGLLGALGAIALAAAYAGSRWGVLGLLAAMALGAVLLFVLALRRPREAVEPDPSADAQLVGAVPNVAIAEMVIDELGQQGIPAFYKLRGVGPVAEHRSRRLLRRVTSMPPGGMLGPPARSCQIPMRRLLVQ